MVRRMWAWTVLLLVVVVGVAQCEDRWVWSKSSPNTKASSIPGFVEPTTTQPPPVTTFRPSFRPMGRGASSRPRHFSRVSAIPFFMGSFPPFPLDPPHTAPDGTTKSRVTADTAFDGASGAVLDAGDKYTTLDRLQSERGAAPPLPRPQEHQLGGLHPDEVFYADDDLLIIKGGGFNSDAFEEPSQPLDADDDIREGSPTRISSVVAPLPSSHKEYNGNIPAIVPHPEQRISHRPFSLFVEGASTNNYVLVPYVYPQPQGNVLNTDGTLTNRIDDDLRDVGQTGVRIPYMYPRPFATAAIIRHPPVHQTFFAPAVSPYNYNRVASPQVSHPGSLKVPHSLAGDTDVNFKFPLPSINPDAEVFAPVSQQTYYYPSRVRQRGRPKL
ncbi:uncharacterized protein LOC121861781 [Homarus americanus]|uniref:Uncharacterized protein n=1 Tax=Homarus americanus TaxID=6706 RepID=A0A8J5NE71_HOMAM|nr:uncharacterized protein LOC121861781 [Homarus americanus]KAG7177639.1 hypothetical protein Hamer_G008285 [Homarus americanus]